MCGIILLIFVFSNNVNKNVAENMIGRMLYISVDNENTKAYMYDFDTKMNISLSQLEKYGNVKKMQFIKADMVAGICVNEDVVGIYTLPLDGQASLLYQMEDVKEIIAFDCDDKGETLLVAYEDTNGNSCVFSIKLSGDVIQYVTEDKKVTGACFSYNNEKVLVSVKKDNTVIYSSKIADTSLSAECMIGQKKGSVVSTYDKGYFIQYDSSFSRFISVKEYESTLKFCEDNHKYYGLCVVTDNKFIVASDKNGNTDIYVCNGSNMDAVDTINDELVNIPMDYLQVKE